MTNKQVETNPKPEAPPSPKMVAESDFLAFKKGSEARERTLKAELAQVKAELKLAQTSLEDDDEVAVVRKELLRQARELEEKLTRHEADTQVLAEDRKAIKAERLASKYGMEAGALLLEGDEVAMERKALEVYSERLSKEKKELEEKAAAQGKIYEHGAPAVTKKMPRDMSDEEFRAHLRKLEAGYQETLRKR